ncbi:methyltransferase domain-containing protein [Colwellia sp. KU-HH00111]|uniref:class I SAM-dependent methyltransferase n=1 Tax=Colwellia sp. KU-HH00111 TaxID=3127652 RepID=UPI00310B6AC6
MQHSALLEKYLPSIHVLKVDEQTPVLDLACGNGRNGLYLIENGINVTFADVNSEPLKNIEQSLNQLDAVQQQLAKCWNIDFEQSNTEPLKGKCFSAIMVFRYLHRPLFEQIKASIKPGGIIIYETFTEQQAQFGRPKNPNFLLKSGELVDIFSDWIIEHHFEGVVNTSEHIGTQQAIAQIIAIKPNC